MSIAQRRYNYYKDNHFLHFEAMSFKDVPYTSKSGEKRAYNVFLRDMVKDRKLMWNGLVKESEAMKWSKTRFNDEWKKLVLYQYQENGWRVTNPKVRVAGALDPFKMLQYFRNLAITQGRWRDTPTTLRKRKRHYVYDPITGKTRRLDKVKLSEQRKIIREKKARQKSRQAKKLRSSPLSDHPELRK